MRWLLCHPGPDYSVHDVYTGWIEALRGLGEPVAEFNLNQRLRFYDAALLETGEDDGQGHPQVRKAFERDEAVNLAAQGVLSLAYTTWPDVVFLISAFFISPGYLEVMRSRGHKVVILHTESPYQDEAQLKRAAAADLNLVNDPVSLPAFETLAPAAYMPHAYRPSVHYPGAPVPGLESDFVFAGTGWKSRQDFFESMNLDGLNVALAGAWPHLDGSPLRKYLCHDSDKAADNSDVATLYRSSKAGINFYRREGDEGMTPGVACGPREIEMAACQLFFLRDPRPESDGLFPMLPTFDGAGDASEKLRWHLARDDVRERQAKLAREAVADRTFTNNARRLLRLLDGL